MLKQAIVDTITHFSWAALIIVVLRLEPLSFQSLWLSIGLIFALNLVHQFIVPLTLESGH
jgi:hypothetical protein